MPDPAPQLQPSRILTDPASGRQVELIYAFPPQAVPLSEPEEPLSNIASILLQGWRRIVLVTALFAAIGVAYALSKPNVYTATATALPPPEKGNILGQLSGPAAAFGIPLSSIPVSSADAVLAILNSRRLREPVLERFALQAYYRASTRDGALKAFNSDFIVKHDKRANVITISYTHIDPVVAAAVTNAACEILSEIYSEISQNNARRERLFLEDRIRATEAELAAATKDFAQFQSERGTIEIESQTKATIDALARLQGELIGQQIELRALLAAAAAPDNLQAQLIQQRIAATQTELQRLLSAGDGVFLGLTRLPELSIAFIERYRAVKKYETVLQALTAQLEAARINEVRSMEAVTIVDRAKVPDTKSGPKRSLISIVAAFLGAAIGGGWVFVSHMISQHRAHRKD